MQEAIKILIAIGILILGFPIGVLLKNITKDEQKSGQIYFKTLTLLSLIAGIIGLITRIDWLLFTGFFVSIVTSRSLKSKAVKKSVKKS